MVSRIETKVGIRDEIFMLSNVTFDYEHKIIVQDLGCT